MLMLWQRTKTVAVSGRIQGQWEAPLIPEEGTSFHALQKEVSFEKSWLTIDYTADDTGTGGVVVVVVCGAFRVHHGRVSNEK
jgi:hypothetical protein